MAPTPSDRVEDEQEQLNRQLDQLLQELRVAMPGVQVLFGFLLAVPFNARFGEVDDTQRIIYLVTLVLAALATAFLVAPTAYHRVMFRQRDKPQLIRTATRMAIVGIGCLGLAMTGSVLLAAGFLFRDHTAIPVAAGVFATFAWLWFGLASARRIRGKRSH